MENSALETAIAREDIELIKNLINKGANVNAVNRETGETSLMLAAYTGNLQLVKILLEAGALANAVNRETGETALVFAAQRGHKDIFEYLLPLTTDLQQKQYAEAELPRGLLLKARRDDPLLSSLIAAVVRGEIQTIRELIVKGANINVFDENGETPLYISVSNYAIDVARVLLELGADPNTPAENDSYTPLAEAIVRRYTEMVTLLIEAGANPDLLVNGATPLMIAAESNCLDIANVLLQTGIDVNFRTENGQTALFFAARSGKIEMMQLLQNAGATGDYSEVLEDWRQNEF
ncbi:ankyrin repeat domain-containing protein [Lusitaniella coriacea LEGE 07157]|uniref:Ankyrin repeat domain-containing protein n=1 Tax=Lusitaniella coriacea LEGE 07157 TaxID=945747 RepID=A0A8J7DY24_9CYAN|nr:ankyrin repeat domain-containing protein [Lusitaniella coriacea]MBE9117549.1 ankyrin repeat domain-containing protein [Lusitaniella coriacea LEGE 07157]